MNPWILSISVAYLLGSIPFGYLLVRIFRKEDVRAQGSGNIGATNVARSGGKGLGVATLLLFRVGGAILTTLASRMRAPRKPWARLGLANLHRPGSSTPLMLVSVMVICVAPTVGVVPKYSGDVSWNEVR